MTVASETASDWSRVTDEGDGRNRPVIVVGAGPVGLASALALRARGRPVLVLEAEPEDRSRPGSRAIFVHRESLQLLESFHAGLGRRVAAAGLVWPTRRSTFRGRDVYVRTYPPPPPDRLPPSTSLPQVETERIILEACREAGVEIAWGSLVIDVHRDPDGVSVVTAGGTTWRAPYVIAADGARSGVRAALGIAMEGPRHEAPFVIVDVHELSDRPMAPERVFHYEHPGVDGRNVLLVPFAGGWRVDLQCREEDDPEDFNSYEGVQRWLARVIDAGYSERIAWVSTYRFLQVLATAFTDTERRVLLVGEAAHLFAPFGARGMNSGFADAQSAAEAVDTALGSGDREAARRAVEHFAADRRDAAEYNRAAAGAALAHMQAKDPRLRRKRRLAAAMAPFVKRAGLWLDTAPYGPTTGRGGQSGRY
ncbi:MAG: FAD-dependent monooxygenase [Actinomycetota bacterium]|nr:FAD-dependent monooxygenase [Actinomycetota bacterium]